MLRFGTNTINPDISRISLVILWVIFVVKILALDIGYELEMFWLSPAIICNSKLYTDYN